MDEPMSEDERRIYRGNMDLDSEDERVLEEDRIILAKVQPSTGTRRVSASILSSPRSRHDSARGSDETSSGSPENSVIEDNPIALDLPVSADSVAGLHFIGLTLSTAREIESRWKSSCREYGVRNTEMLDFIEGHFLGMGQPPAPEERQLLERFGIDGWLVDALLDPKHESVAQTETLRFWVLDSLRVSYVNLESTVRRLKILAHHNRRQKKRAGKSAASSSTEQSTPAIDPVVTANMPLSIIMKGAPPSSLAIRETPEILPDHIVLYKGMANDERHPGMQLVDAKGRLQLEDLETRSGGDFNAREKAAYWTRERETAEQYRQWAKTRSPAFDTYIITIQVPRPFYNSLEHGQLWFGDQWRRFILACRRGRIDRTSEAEADLLPYHDNMKVIEGHICHKRYIQRDSEPSDLTREYVMKLRSGGSASQVAFLHEAMTAVQNEISGKIHAQCFPAERT